MSSFGEALNRIQEKACEKNKFFAELYNRKRTANKAEITKINDVLPVGYGGV